MALEVRTRNAYGRMSGGSEGAPRRSTEQLEQVVKVGADLFLLRPLALKTPVPIPTSSPVWMSGTSNTGSCQQVARRKEEILPATHKSIATVKWLSLQ